MICTQCNNNLIRCVCSDFPERIRNLLDSNNLFFSADQKRILLRRAKEIEGQNELNQIGKENQNAS